MGIQDLKEAINISMTENKPLLLFFTGISRFASEIEKSKIVKSVALQESWTSRARQVIQDFECLE